MKNLINLTPHPVNIILDEETITIQKSGNEIPRLSTTTSVVGDINGIPITRTVMGKTQNLPSVKDGVFLIVSRLILAANPNRKDLLVPNEIVRNGEGHIIGCKSFDAN